MAEWVKIGADVLVGGGLGAVDQLIQNQDEKREAEKGAKLPVLQRYGTYFNYGLPILAIIATALGHLKGDWATRLVTAGSMLAGRKATYQVAKKPAAWTPWTRSSQLEAQRRAALEAARVSAKTEGPVPQILTPTGTIPIISIAPEEAILA